MLIGRQPARVLLLTLSAAFLLAGVTLAAPAVPAESVRSFADLDGDLHPDSIRYSVQGTDGQGYLYTVVFNMSARRESPPIGVHAEDGWGLQIVARDVDGDHDLDLVVTSGAHGRAVDVWLNDGHGGFTSAGITAFPASIWIPERTLNAAGNVPVRDASIILSDGWPAALMPAATSYSAHFSTALRCNSPATQADSPRLNSARPRAPPAV